MSTKPFVVVVRPKRPPPVLICRKCLKRADDGRAIKRTLKSELKQRSKGRSEKRSRVVMTSCFGICPKHAVVVASAGTLQRGEYVLVSDSGQVTEAVGVLMQEAS